MDEQTQAALHRYVAELFVTEDDALRWIQAETERNSMPQISLASQEGHLLQFLVHAVGARTAVEIGTLAGYSGTWLARALPDDGILITLEANPKHAAVARASFERAGVSQKVELIEGPALESLRRIANRGPFDFVFIDANKDDYPRYLDWAIDHLRPGGMVAAHNAFLSGGILSLNNEADRGIHTFNQALADDDRLFSTILAIGDGMAAGIKRS
ncbi:MAG: O-methyltransferase [Anaerolineae bacterium]|nr:O-methyltransferase [Anaerolineae bacterium]